MLKGNHDSWWAGIGTLRSTLPESCEALHNDSHRIGEWVVVGARGWISPDDPTATENDHAIFRREHERLRLSIVDADRRFGRDLPRVAMLHYPPWVEGYPPTPVVETMRKDGVRVCVYGHLHGEDHRLAVTGERDGVRFHFVASDAVGFAPALILSSTEAVTEA